MLPPALQGEVHRRLKFAETLMNEAIEIGRLEAEETRRRVQRSERLARVGLGIMVPSLPTAIVGFGFGIFTRWTTSDASWGPAYFGIFGMALAAGFLITAERGGTRLFLSDRRRQVEERWRALGIQSEFPFSSFYGDAYLRASGQRRGYSDNRTPHAKWYEISGAVIDSIGPLRDSADRSRGQ